MRFFFNDTATTEIYTLSLHDALPICNEPGDYVYRISFNLSGFDLSTVKITGRWAVDSEGVDLKSTRLNSTHQITPFAPLRLETRNANSITISIPSWVST